VRVQFGLVGYGAWQTTDKSTQAGDHYNVNAVGFATNVVLPSQKMSVGFKYFQEFSNRSTFQGHSIQISGSIKF
jgi:hypothetical protein